MKNKIVAINYNGTMPMEWQTKPLAFHRDAVDNIPAGRGWISVLYEDGIPYLTYEIAESGSILFLSEKWAEANIELLRSLRGKNFAVFVDLDFDIKREQIKKFLDLTGADYVMSVTTPDANGLRCVIVGYHYNDTDETRQYIINDADEIISKKVLTQGWW